MNQFINLFLLGTSLFDSLKIRDQFISLFSLETNLFDSLKGRGPIYQFIFIKD